MQPIKFLLWDTKHEAFVNEPYYAISLLGTIQIEGHTSVEPKRYIPLQFTGLMDKNGKEIYEGYIVKTSRNLKAVVEYGNGAYWFNTYKFYPGPGKRSPITGKPRSKAYATQKSKNWETIGNIYENRELLEQM